MTAGDFDLDGYLARIGWAGPLAPDLATLRRLVAHHTAAIPFEGIDALLGRTPAVDAAGLQAKLVGARRGGWCFEQNSLLALALGALGFRARPLLARVVFGLPPGVVLSRTHMVLRVELPEGPHLVDAGFGGVTLTGADRAGSRRGAADPAWPLPPGRPAGRAVAAGLVGGDWVGLYVVAADPQLPADIEAANWLVANRPGGLFTANLVASRAPPGRRLTPAEPPPDAAGSDGRRRSPCCLARRWGRRCRRAFGLALGEADLAAIEAALAAPRPGHIAGLRQPGRAAARHAADSGKVPAMARILVLYYSMYGHVETMAGAVAEGARSAGAEVTIKRVAELVPREVAEKAHAKLDQAAPLASPQELDHYDAIILGCPTRYGRMAAQMAQFWDQTGGLWARGALIGKVGSAFSSTASQHGGQETTLMAMHTMMLHHGMVLVGLPYSAPG